MGWTFCSRLYYISDVSVCSPNTAVPIPGQGLLMWPWPCLVITGPGPTSAVWIDFVVNIVFAPASEPWHCLVIWTAHDLQACSAQLLSPGWWAPAVASPLAPGLFLLGKSWPLLIPDSELSPPAKHWGAWSLVTQFLISIKPSLITQSQAPEWTPFHPARPSFLACSQPVSGPVGVAWPSHSVPNLSCHVHFLSTASVLALLLKQLPNTPQPLSPSEVCPSQAQVSQGARARWPLRGGCWSKPWRHQKPSVALIFHGTSPTCPKPRIPCYPLPWTISSYRSDSTSGAVLLFPSVLPCLAMGPLETNLCTHFLAWTWAYSVTVDLPGSPWIWLQLSLVQRLPSLVLLMPCHLYCLVFWRFGWTRHPFRVCPISLAQVPWSMSLPFHRQQPALIARPDSRLWNGTMAVVLLLLCPWMSMDPVTDIWFCFPVVRYCGVAPNSGGTALPGGWLLALLRLLLSVQTTFHTKYCLLTQLSSVTTSVLWENILKALLKSGVQYPLFSFAYTTSCHILDTNDVCQERFVHGKSVLIFTIIFYSFTCLKMFPGGFAWKPSSGIWAWIQLYCRALVTHIVLDRRRHRPELAECGGWLPILCWPAHRPGLQHELCVQVRREEPVGCSHLAWVTAPSASMHLS